MSRQKVRSGPVYVETTQGTVSLVFQAELREGVAGALSADKPTIFLIDANGVRKLRPHNAGTRYLALGATLMLGAWAIGRLVSDKTK